MTIENKQKENGDSYKTYYRYDDAGNMIMRTHEEMTSGAVTNTVELQNSTVQVDEFKYNDFGEMTKAHVKGVTAAYEYRPDGLRRSKTVSGVTTRHVWDGENICMDLTGDWSTKNRYIRGLRLVEYTAGGTERWQYQYNQHGDVTSVISSENGARKTYEYDAFGNTISQPEGIENPFQYCGEYNDAETGLIYLRARYYDPSVGRFVSEDTHWNPQNMIYGDDEKNNLVLINAIKQSTNLFIYCGSNPLNFYDNTGFAWGDTFTSADDAARDFAKTTNQKSIDEGVEYAAYIYSFKKIEYKEDPITGRICWVETTYYTYGPAFTNHDPDSVKISGPNRLPKGYKLAAIAHTHGCASESADDENFSMPDKGVSRKYGVPIYVATPGGYLKKFIYDDYGGKVIVISSHMPSDPRSPFSKR